MKQIIAKRYLAGLDYSVKPGDVVSEAPFSLSAETLADWVTKGQAVEVEESLSNVEVFETPYPDEYDVLTLDEYGNEVETVEDAEEEG